MSGLRWSRPFRHERNPGEKAHALQIYFSGVSFSLWKGPWRGPALRRTDRHRCGSRLCEEPRSTIRPRFKGKRSGERLARAARPGITKKVGAPTARAEISRYKARPSNTVAPPILDFGKSSYVAHAPHIYFQGVSFFPVESLMERR